MKRLYLLFALILVSISLKAQQEENVVYTAVEVMPTFPGGDAARVKFLADNIEYPDFAKESGITGTVIVSFVINETGDVTDVTLVRGIGGGCDEEAIRVTRMMPRWNPGTLDGKAVKVQYNMPFSFSLSGKKTKAKRKR